MWKNVDKVYFLPSSLGRHVRKRPRPIARRDKVRTQSQFQAL